jgi:hypothetical protein
MRQEARAGTGVNTLPEPAAISATLAHEAAVLNKKMKMQRTAALVGAQDVAQASNASPPTPALQRQMTRHGPSQGLLFHAPCRPQAISIPWITRIPRITTQLGTTVHDINQSQHMRLQRTVVAVSQGTRLHKPRSHVMTTAHVNWAVDKMGKHGVRE